MKPIHILLLMFVLFPLVFYPQTRRAPANRTESAAEVDRREGERIMRAYFDERLLECKDSWWWVVRYQSGRLVESKRYQAKGTPRFIFDGHYIPRRNLSKADELNGVNPQPVEFEGEMAAIFDAARCANCNDIGERRWADNYKLVMSVSKRNGQWIIGEFTDPYTSIRKPACRDDGIAITDEYLTPKTRFNGDYHLSELPSANREGTSRLGVKLDVWCKTKYGNTSIDAYTPGDAYGWKCRVESAGSNIQYFAIDMDAVCQMQYGNTFKALADDPKDYKSWHCVKK